MKKITPNNPLIKFPGFFTLRIIIALKTARRWGLIPNQVNTITSLYSVHFRLNLLKRLEKQ
jgi:hypothetical protein